MTGFREHLKAIPLCAALITSCGTLGSDLGKREGQPHETLNAVLWVQTSAEYDMSTEQAYRLAAIRLGEALEPENARWTAAVEQTGRYWDLPPAVVLDIDEAVLDNSSFAARLVRRRTAFDLEAWNTWVREEQALAVPGALAFVKLAHGRAVRIFYVTNRTHDVEDPTRRNLANLGFPVDADGGNILSKGERAGWRSDKRPRRAFVAERYRILLLVGDDLNDFVSGSEVPPEKRVELARRFDEYWGVKWIVIPNPVYGRWEGSLHSDDRTLSPSQILQRKIEALETLE
jgi:acid phosphatase